MWARVLVVSAAVVVAQGALWSGAAHAATPNVFLNGSVLHYEASNLANAVTITHAGTNIIIDDNQPMTPGSNCWSIDGTKVACAEAGVTVVRVDGNGGNDRINSAMDLPVSFWGGPGDDELSGGDGNDTLRGGPDDDTLRGGAGRDGVSYYGETLDVRADLDGVRDDGPLGQGDLIGTDVEDLFGGEGDDTLQGSSADNYLYGNGGNDHIRGFGGEDTIYGAGGDDRVEGDDDTDQVHGGDGTDWVRGGSGNDLLYGDADDDLIEGGLGLDHLWGGAGNDELHGQGDLDFMDGGDDGDVCHDITPWVTVSCE
jgi:Ca2+-binding RTX toxin-like protein